MTLALMNVNRRTWKALVVLLVSLTMLAAGSPTAVCAAETKTVLFLRIMFAGETTEPMTFAQSQTLMSEVSSWYNQGSYGYLTLTPTVAPNSIVLPHTKAEYGGYTDPLYTDLLAAATAAGYNPANYTLYVMRFTEPIGPGGDAALPSLLPPGGVRIYGPSQLGVDAFMGVLVHELGHVLGLGHAGSWATTSFGPNGNGRYLEYGDNFDTMGYGAFVYPPPPFSMISKRRLNWLPDSWINAVTSSGVYRIYAQDTATLVSGRTYGFRVRKNFVRDYWGETHQQSSYPSGHGAFFHQQNGLILRWANAAGLTLAFVQDTNVIDGFGAPLILGRTRSDPGAGVHITPIAKGGTAPDSWMDVAVNIGSFAGNNAPTLSLSASPTSVGVNVPVTFTATASDVDGDSLAYYWEINGKAAQNISLNANVISKSWPSASLNHVRCVVSDKKGGIASAYVLITVGSPTRYTITGRIMQGGTPIEGVTVQLGSGEYTFTDSGGYYSLVSIGSGGQLVAYKAGYTFSPSGFSIPANQNASAKNFTATELSKISITANNSTVAEDCPDATFTISRTGSTAQPLSVTVLRGGTATYSTDYVTSPALAGIGYQTVTIPAGASSTTISLLAIDDYNSPGGQTEGSETVSFALIENDAYQVAWPAEATVTVQDNNVPATVDFNTSLSRICESGADAVLTVSRSGSTAQSLVVDLESIGTAVFGTHYQILVNGTPVASSIYSITIPAGSASQNFAIRPINTTQQEGARSVICNFRCSNSYRRGTTRISTVWLHDDESLPSIQVTASPAAILEGASNPDGTFTVTRTEACLDQPLTVSLQTSGVAIRGTDYEIRVGGSVVTSQPFSVIIPANQIDTTFTLRVLNDTAYDLNKLATCSIATSASYVIGTPSSGSIDVQDNDKPSIVLIEPNDHLNEATPTVVVNQPVTRTGNAVDVTVNLRLRSSTTATLNQDFTLKVDGVLVASPTFSVFLPASTSSKNIEVAALQDTWAEGPEQIDIEVVPSASYLSDGYSNMQIDDDGDAATASVSVVATDAVAKEPDGGTDNGTFTITRTGGPSELLTVSYSVSGTATPDSDYQALSGTATFQPNQTTTTVNVNVLNDSSYEGNETISLQLNSGLGYSVGGPEDATVKIISLFDLGTIAGQSSSAGLGINTANAIAGQSGTHAFRDANQVLEAGDDLHAAVTQIYNAGGAGSTVAWDISDSDRIVGEWTSTATNAAWYRGFVYSTPTYQNLAFPGATENHVRGIAPWSGGAQAAGWSRVSGFHHFLHWYIYDNPPSSTYAYDIGSSYWPNYHSYAYAVTDARLVGYVDYPTGSQAILWDWAYSSSGPTYLPKDSGDTLNRAYDINYQSGAYYRVAGESSTATARRACYWTYSSWGNAPITKMSSPSGWNSVGLGVNGSGQMVGAYHQDYAPAVPDHRAALWENGNFVDLYALGIGSGWTLYTAEKINSSGAIVGTGLVNGQVHAYLARP